MQQKKAKNSKLASFRSGKSLFNAFNQAQTKESLMSLYKDAKKKENNELVNANLIVTLLSKLSKLIFEQTMSQD